MDKYLELIKNILHNNFVKSGIVIILSVIIYKIVSSALIKSETKNGRRKVGQKDKTYIRLIRNFMKYAFFIIVLFIILQINGIDVSSMVAGVGVLSIIIGFIVQDAFKDIIRGIDIISDNYFVVGDVVKYGEIEGKVLMVRLKTTKIQDVKTLNIVSIANRNIEQVEIISKELFITIPMPYEVKVDKAENVIKDILNEISENEKIEESIYKGVNKFAESNIEYLIEIKCNPIDKLEVRRNILRTVLVILNKHKINIPYQQIDIHINQDTSC